MRIKLMYWDGTTDWAETRSEAVQKVVRGLTDWMNDGDHISWSFTRAGGDPVAVKPEQNWTSALAVVCCETGDTDALCAIAVQS